MALSSNSQISPHSKNHQSYVLLHGAWHGSWCWHKVVNHGEKLGHTILTPDLPGHCANTNAGPFKDIALNSYVDHVQQLISEIQGPVTLVGHSMAGVIISQIAENIPHKIDRLIYVSGFIPENRGSLVEEEKKTASPSVALEVILNEGAASIELPLHVPKRICELFYGTCSEEDSQYALARLQKQPLRPFINTISISQARFGRVPKLYIECLQDQAIMIQDQRRMHLQIDCEVASLNSDHSPFFSAADQLANLIFNRF